ncbi:unnamed protein product, partial [marine sediment metagenome]
CIRDIKKDQLISCDKVKLDESLFMLVLRGLQDRFG